MIEKEKEIWKDVPGYEGYYQVSDFGRVKSLDRVVIDSRGGKRFYKGRIIKGSIDKGYRQTTLRGTCFTFSQLVAMAFLGYKLNGHKLVVDHKNGNRSDDRVVNLRIVTNRENLSTCFRSNEYSFSSLYPGVYYHNENNNWVANISLDKRKFFLGSFDNEFDASKAYQLALSKIKDGTFNPEDYKPKFKSKYKGVSFYKKIHRWGAHIRVKGKLKYIGVFTTEIEAHKAYESYKANLNNENNK